MTVTTRPAPAAAADLFTISVKREQARMTRAAKHDDPVKRMTATARAAADIKAAANTARVARDHAATALVTVHGVKAVRVYRLIDVHRGLLVKIVERVTTAGGPDPAYTADEEYAAKVAARMAPLVKPLDALARACRDERDRLIRDFRTGADVPVMSSAEIARRTGLTTARIAQLRPAELAAVT